MTRVAALAVVCVSLLSITGCGKKINRVTRDKVTEAVQPSMTGGEKMNWGAVEEILGGKGKLITAKEYKKLTKRDPKKGADVKIWHGKRGTYIAIEYDPKTERVKGIYGNVPQ